MTVTFDGPNVVIDVIYNGKPIPPFTITASGGTSGNTGTVTIVVSGG